MNFEKYTHDTPFPWRKNFTTYHYYKGGEYLGQFSTVQGAVVEKVVDEKGYNAAIEAFYKAESDVEQQFFDDLAEELGITSHPKKDKFLSLCWQEGHSGGWNDVYSVACTWVELLED